MARLNKARVLHQFGKLVEDMVIESAMGDHRRCFGAAP